MQILRPAPKTERSAAPWTRVRELAARLEQAERRVLDGLSPAAVRGLQEGQPALQILGEAVDVLRWLASHWEARRAEGLPVPLIGRVRKEALRKRQPEWEKQLLAIGKWIRRADAGNQYWSGPTLFRELITTFASAHTTCFCGICIPAGGRRRTCAFVAACRAAFELGEEIAVGSSPMRLLLVTAFEVASALETAEAQILEANPGIASAVDSLAEDAGAVPRLLFEPELAVASGLECSVVAMRVIAKALRWYGEVRCQVYELSLAKVGVVGRGAPKLGRARAQHLARGGLQLVRSGSGFRVKPLPRLPGKAKGEPDERTTFIRAIPKPKESPDERASFIRGISLS